MSLDRKIQRDVLIIDDDKDICEILRDYCHNLGCFKNIVIANDGIMASLKLRNQKFSLILLDINMPKKTGVDLLNDFEVGSLNTKDHVLIISGTLEKVVIEKILNQGVKNFLVKPFDESHFQEKAMKILTAPVVPPVKPPVKP